jgi:hypothetical protein
VAPPKSTYDLSVAVVSIVNKAIASSDAQVLKQIIGASVSSVNSVDCSEAPDCASINREICSTTASTCGSCKSGYYGINGHSNTYCMKIKTKASSRRLQSAQSSLVSNIIPCKKNSDCFSGFCNNNICADVKGKGCPNECSSNGVCRVYDYDGNIVSKTKNCYLGDEFCFATCFCVTGRYGDDCSLDKLEYEMIVSVQEATCLAIHKTLQIQDIDDIFETSLQYFSSLFLKTGILNAKFTNLCVGYYLDMILSHYNLIHDDETLILVVNGLSNILQRKDNILSATNSIKIRKALKYIISFHQSKLVIQESTINLFTENIRVFSTKIFPKSLSSLSIQPPQSSIESYLGIYGSEIKFKEIEYSYNLPITVSIIQMNWNDWVENINIDDSNSYNFQMQISFDPTSSLLNDYYQLQKFDILLQNVEEITSYVKQDVVKGNLFCDWSPVPYNLTAKCLYGHSFNVTCPGNFPGYLNYTCPALATFPGCGTYNKFDKSTSQCILKSYTPTNISCECSNSLNMPFSSDLLKFDDFIITYDFISSSQINRTAESTQLVLIYPDKNIY